LLVNTAEKGTVENRRYKRIHRAWIIVPSAALALGMTGGTVALLQAQVTEKNHVLCFARAERNGSSFPGGTVTVLQGTKGIPLQAPPAVPIEDAVAVCSDMWKQHALDASMPNGSPGPGQEDPTFSHPVPDPLTVCVWNGMAAVIPGGPAVCAKLGLAPAEVSTGP
ncbi:MAG: hypothetical protein ACREJ4_05720, partial [Candidatus Methylomirabilaceae bacterium]